MMALNCEVTLDIDSEDLAAILTEEFCEGYSAFRNLKVEAVAMLEDGRTFQLTMTPKATTAENA